MGIKSDGLNIFFASSIALPSVFDCQVNNFTKILL